MVSSFMLGTGRGESHLPGPALLRWGGWPCGGALGAALSPTLEPRVSVMEGVEEITFKKFKVVFHALNSGLIFFECHLFIYLLIFLFLPFQG